MAVGSCRSREGKQDTYLEVTLVSGEETLELSLWVWDARPDLLLQSPAVGQQGQHCQQQRDEDKDERQRQDERVQVWEAGRRSERFARSLAQLLLHPRNWGLTASGQQRRGLRPGAPESAEAWLGHARSNSEGVVRPTPQVAQYTLSASFQDLYLGAGGARRQLTN